jgi:hypothetical protein
VDAARALADLVEISPQIEAAAILAGNGEPVGSIGVPEARGTVLARAAGELLDGAAASRSEGRVTQLHAALDGGDVYVVAGGGERKIVALTSRRTAPGLVFYDLKRCLAALEETHGEA